MKILHIIYTHGISGAEKYLDYLLPGLKNYGIDCHLLLICPPASVSKLEGFAEMWDPLESTCRHASLSIL